MIQCEALHTKRLSSCASPSIEGAFLHLMDNLNGSTSLAYINLRWCSVHIGTRTIIGLNRHMKYAAFWEHCEGIRCLPCGIMDTHHLPNIQTIARPKPKLPIWCSISHRLWCICEVAWITQNIRAIRDVTSTAWEWFHIRVAYKCGLLRRHEDHHIRSALSKRFQKRWRMNVDPRFVKWALAQCFML